MKVFAENRKALHDYFILDRFDAGISLFGYEVKAVREGKANFEGSFIEIAKGDAVLHNLHIGKYSKQGDISKGDERRDRNLLLKNFEIDRLSAKATQKGFSLVPLKLKDEHGIIKLEFALVRGKKKYEKKVVVKKRQEERDLRRESKDLVSSISYIVCF